MESPSRNKKSFLLKGEPKIPAAGQFETAVDKPPENIQKIKKNIGRSKNDSQKNIYSKNKEYDDKF